MANRCPSTDSLSFEGEGRGKGVTVRFNTPSHSLFTLRAGEETLFTDGKWTPTGLRPWHYLNEFINFNLGIHPRAYVRGLLIKVEALARSAGKASA